MVNEIKNSPQFKRRDDFHRRAHGQLGHRVGRARVLAALFAASGAGHALPEVLNVAQPGAVRMDALLRAAGRPWRGVPAPDAALPEVTLNTGALEAVIGPLPRADAGAIVADLGRLAGARP